ncbi:hypothetical protein N5J06_22405 [Ralstonia sp. CHL-2022]|uniref:N-acetyltransferase domain-containing protein n=1 Tax=Ralstonia mojiangensis TaxID=2953895 RepID=A0ABT2LGD7_9RALS|nr:hypothetical protein [Ralstonia mojiangensis]MCT7295490.1 hypothetical protein [Ralstonia mojiangensis]MCT7313733.1 hypothetical protein [Ralstonia mojiangensis]
METTAELGITVDADWFPVTDYEPSRFVWEWAGHVELLDAETRAASEIGTFAVRYVDAESAMNARESLFDVFDSDSTTIDYYAALYEGAWFKDGLAGFELSEDYGQSANLLILDRLLIRPAYRSRGFGLAALAALIRRFGMGAGLIAMKPFPLQFEHSFAKRDAGGNAPAADEYELRVFSGSRRTATAKLKRYYAALGFKTVRNTEFMVRPPAAPLPEPHSLRQRWEHNTSA